MRFLDLIRPITYYLPSVKDPEKPVTFNDKIYWTAWTLCIYLICCQIPLYGPIKSQGADPLYFIRVIMASNKGTIMELGMSPSLSAGWILFVLHSAKLIDVNMKS